MSKSMNKVLSMILMVGMIMAGVIFFQGSVSATDSGIDMSGSSYEDTYNTTTTLSIQSISMINIIMFILAVMAIIVAVKGFAEL